jgi:hypothetical protein
VLRAAAACRTARCATRTLTRSRFGPIDAMALWHLHGRYRIGTALDGFPHPIYHLVKFSPARFLGERLVAARLRPPSGPRAAPRRLMIQAETPAAEWL